MMFFHAYPLDGSNVTHHFLTRFCHLLRTALQNDANIISGFPMIYTYGLYLGFVISASVDQLLHPNEEKPLAMVSRASLSFAQ